MDKFVFSKKEEAIKKRLLQIGVLIGGDDFFYDLFKDNTCFTNEELESLNDFYNNGSYDLVGYRTSINGQRQLVEDDLSNCIMKYILTGERKYFMSLKDWFKWHLRKQKEHNDEQFAEEVIKKQQSQTKSGYIYVIKSLNLFKIGRARNLKERIKVYTTENPHGLKVICSYHVSDYIEVEKILLNKFKDKNVKGEWFQLKHSDIKIIKQIVEGFLL